MSTNTAWDVILIVAGGGLRSLSVNSDLLSAGSWNCGGHVRFGRESFGKGFIDKGGDPKALVESVIMPLVRVCLNWAQVLRMPE